MNMEPKTCETEHDFALVLADIELTSHVEDALFQAGCDDATLSLRCGRPYLTFSRSAASIKDAILSAVENVQNANIGAKVLRVDFCNLVTQADIARRINKSRQLVHQFITGVRGPGHFPPPACNITDDAPLWYWCEVAHWLWTNNMIKEDVLREAEQVTIINYVLELENQKEQNPELTEELLKWAGRKKYLTAS